MKAYQLLSRAQRSRTPRRLAERLLLALPGADILWVAPTSVYRSLVPPERIWDRLRDARTYAGPGPIIAHPPCGPWTRIRGGFMRPCGQDADDGRIAMELVHRWGGVVEQPATSRLFAVHGQLGATYSFVRQGDWIDGVERLSSKPTVLYWWHLPLREPEVRQGGPQTTGEELAVPTAGVAPAALPRPYRGLLDAHAASEAGLGPAPAGPEPSDDLGATLSLQCCGDGAMVAGTEDPGGAVNAPGLAIRRNPR